MKKVVKFGSMTRFTIILQKYILRIINFIWCWSFQIITKYVYVFVTVYCINCEVQICGNCITITNNSTDILYFSYTNRGYLPIIDVKHTALSLSFGGSPKNIIFTKCTLPNFLFLLPTSNEEILFSYLFVIIVDVS